jgi:hypothetical protein
MGGHVPNPPLSELTVTKPFNKLVPMTRTASSRLQHLALDVIDFPDGLEAFGKAARAFAGTPKREQEQEHGEHNGVVT